LVLLFKLEKIHDTHNLCLKKFQLRKISYYVFEVPVAEFDDAIQTIKELRK